MSQQLLYIVSLVLKSNRREKELPKRDVRNGWSAVAQRSRIDETKSPPGNRSGAGSVQAERPALTAVPFDLTP